MGACERDEGRREEYRGRVGARDASDFVIVDGCGSNIDLAPLYARAPRGERAYGKAPRNKEANTTLIAAMDMGGMGPAMTPTGGTDKAAFAAYVGELLVPWLAPGGVVAMDDLGAHLNRRVRELIEGEGCEVWFLPPYSPDLSPVEEASSKLKGLSRKAEARTREALERAIAEALGAITASDAEGYFAHCGYGIAAARAEGQ